MERLLLAPILVTNKRRYEADEEEVPDSATRPVKRARHVERSPSAKVRPPVERQATGKTTQKTVRFPTPRMREIDFGKVKTRCGVTFRYEKVEVVPTTASQCTETGT